MCLATVEDVRELPEYKDKEVVAYKILEEVYKSEKREYVFQTPYRDFVIETNKWLQAIEVTLYTRVEGEIRGKYTSGFHAYILEEDAKSVKEYGETVVKVLLRGVHTRGIDGTSNWTKESKFTNIVASEMFIDGSQLEAKNQENT